MRIAIVTQYYPPESVPLPSTLAHGLADRGHDVRVITGYPNYPAGRLASGYRQRFVHQERDGKVVVRRVPIIISHSSNPVGRLANYLSFGLSSMTAGRFVRDVDVVYVYATQMTAGLAPSLWRRTRGIPFVLHIQDIWPESITASSMIGGGRLSSVISTILTPWLRRMYRDAAATIAIGPSMARMLEERGGPAGRVHFVYNWAPTPGTAIAPDALPELLETEPSLRLMYAGNLGHMQDLETVVHAAGLVRDLPNFRLDIFGTGVAEKRLRDLVRELDVSAIGFHGRVPADDLARHYARTDFQLVTLRNLPIFRATVPSKLQSSLSSGIPVITTVVGDVAALVQAEGLGLTSVPEDAKALARTFREAYALSNTERREMGERGKTLYETSMSATSGIDRLERILVDAAKTSRRNGHND